MKKKFGLCMMLCSAVGAALGMGLLIEGINWGFADTPIDAVLHSVVFFPAMLLFGFSGMYLAIWLTRKKYQVDTLGAGKRLITILLLSALLGGVGQLLYGFELRTYTTTKAGDTPVSGLHLVVLMDISSSMDDEREVCADAACQLIESLDETASMQFIAFAATVPGRGESAFLPLTKEHKATLQNMVRTVYLGGGTNFDEPLDKAIATLQAHHDPACRSLIIMLTDGEDSVNGTIRDVLTDPDSGIELFTMRITDGSGTVSANTQDLIDMAAMDFPIVPESNGTVDVSAVQQAFRSALNYSQPIAEEETRLELSAHSIFADSEHTMWWHPVVQIAVFALYALLISLAYYGRSSVRSMMLNLGMGTLTGLMMAVGALEVYVILLTVCLTTFTILEIEGGASHV